MKSMFFHVISTRGLTIDEKFLIQMCMVPAMPRNTRTLVIDLHDGHVQTLAASSHLECIFHMCTCNLECSCVRQVPGMNGGFRIEKFKSTHFALLMSNEESFGLV